ncbi:hypothetical protein GCM10010399_25540 [Dactylosporangium fulvum]|uniref:Integral membrane protein n=1 Tax=Dactylosporangium fulvum TaxID=53359 RepID=A0ABY5WA66_9ACTN|nr:hypothetical protein [Dactylosporangium fulvum]UWP86962.1 hypothetical protein Dfulv_23060 [Dactylosporangium fulvum]
MTEHRPVSPGLRRRYRRLLLAYPGAYRRHHGAEILTTLMDAAGPGRERPTAAEVRDVVAGGLRQRFRLPVGRLMMLAALLTALTLGGLGASVGSAIGWSTAQRPPTDAAVGEMIDLATGGSVRHNVSRHPGPLGQRSQVIASTADFTTVWSPEQARSRLAAAGWRVNPAATGQTESYLDADGVVTTIPMDATSIVAERDGITLKLTIGTYRGGPPYLDGTSNAMLVAMPAEPVSVLPLTVVGLLLGLLGGWLLAARAGYRLRRAASWQRAPINGLTGAAVLLLAPSTIAAWYFAGRATVAAAGSGPAGFDQLPVPPAYVAYIHDLTPAWYTIAALVAGAIVLVLSMTVRPRPALIQPFGEPGR